MSEKMPAATLEALKGSIEKWEKIVAGTGIDRGGENCPLCQMFIPDESDAKDDCRDCVGCPVMEKTGEPNCDETPFYEWRLVAQVYELWSFKLPPEDHPSRGRALAAAQAELDFLRSLLPAEE